MTDISNRLLVASYVDDHRTRMRVEAGWTGKIHRRRPHNYELKDWAARHGLNRGGNVNSARCLQWLLEGRKHEHSEACQMESWMEEMTHWTRDGWPAVLLSQPRRLRKEDRTLLNALATSENLIVKVYEGGWMSNQPGRQTFSVEVWHVAAYAAALKYASVPPQWI